jgi:hypothetical protein
METLLNRYDRNDKTHVGSVKERSQDQSATLASLKGWVLEVYWCYL